MEQIPIQIKTKQSDDSRTMRSNNIDLNNKESHSKKTGKGFFFWLLLVIVMVEAGAITFLYFINTTPPFYSLLPSNPTITAYFNQSSLNSLLQTLKNSQTTVWLPFASANQSLSAFLAKNNINAAEISSILEDRMSLALLTPSTGDKPIWLFFATVKNSPDEVASIIKKAERDLKQNFNLVSDTYRQIDIEEIKPLDQNQNSIFFAQPNNLFLLSNDSQTLKDTIDKALK